MFGDMFLRLDRSFSSWRCRAKKFRLNGFSCCRIADLRGLRRDPYAAFSEAARRKFKDPKPRKPRVSLATVEDLLTSAGKLLPLVAIHREKVRPDVCHIGRAEKAEQGQVTLLEIGPDAKWDRKPTSYRLGEVTMVEFGDEYERALVLVGGKPPR
jgi:hypothetical protein